MILCHGSRGETALQELPSTMDRVVRGVTAMLPEELAVTWGALQFNTPTLEDAAETLIAGGATTIIIVPYFLFSGRHIEEDIPEIVTQLEARYPGVTFRMAASLGDREVFISEVMDRIRNLFPEPWLAAASPAEPPEAIESRSLAIIGQLLPERNTLSEDEKSIVKRIVHASGDPQTAGLVRFGRDAVTAGLDAITGGRPLFTDVRMTAAGINRGSAARCRCPVICALDETDEGSPANGPGTRAAAAIRRLGRKLDGATAVIGNAPTALFELIHLIDDENIRPALVIGMPVGFVQASESKESLMRRTVPYITVTGTRGGSAMAAATVNALLKIALQ